MAEAPTTPVPPPPPVTVTAGDADDPFQRLHKMSVTAGLGSGDYVAISGLAVAAVLLGVASVLVLFHIRFLLLIPVAGVVCSVLAWRAVGQSNGTLTGRGLAVLGLLLSLGLGGYETAAVVNTGLAARSAQAEVIGVIRGFGQDVINGRFQQAYDRTDAEFQNNVQGPVKLDTFEGTLQRYRNSGLLGKLNDVDWNGLLNFDVDPVTGQPIATGMVLMKYDKASEPVRTDMFFRKTDKGWAIDRIPELFPPPAPQRTGPLGPAGSGGGKPQQFGPARPS